VRSSGIALVVALAASCTSAAPPSEAVLLVDTDAPVPKLAARLRVDVYGPDMTWYATRDVSVGKASDWPASFALTLPDGAAGAFAAVRLRTYPEGGTRDYLGERYAAPVPPCDGSPCTDSQHTPPACCPLSMVRDVPPTSGPQLAGGVTPASEPDPRLTIDRIVTVALQPGMAGAALVTLATACVGTMADVANLRSCVDTAGVLVAATNASLQSGTPSPGPSTRIGTYEQELAQPCDVAQRSTSTYLGVSLHDEDVCVPGGLLVLGGRDSFYGDTTDALPRRVVAVSSFLLDRHEYTVRRARRAVADGTSVVVGYNEGALGGSASANAYCTATIGPGDREEYPLNCIDWAGARSLCQHDGADLPTEAQWEYAAAQAARDAKTEYPWGDADPTGCSGVAYGRLTNEECAAYGSGPVTVTADDTAGGDLTPGIGLVDLGGNLEELALDSFAPYAAVCWGQPLQVDAACIASGTTAHPLRGGSWLGSTANLRATSRDVAAAGTQSTIAGFRCARPGRQSP
jgi:formylglycine-generating enzyme required for sulfatase activity